MLLMSTRPGMISQLSTTATPEWTVRTAEWPADYDAVCAVRKPTQFVVEDGGAGFMGQKTVIVDPAEAQQRRVQARLASVLKDNATVLLVEDVAGRGAVVGTLDCVRQQCASEPGATPQPRVCAATIATAATIRAAAAARAAAVAAAATPSPERPEPDRRRGNLRSPRPRRGRLLRNLWVEPTLRRQGTLSRLKTSPGRCGAWRRALSATRPLCGPSTRANAPSDPDQAGRPGASPAPSSHPHRTLTVPGVARRLMRAAESLAGDEAYGAPPRHAIRHARHGAL